MLRLKATKTSLYALVAQYVDDLPPMKKTRFVKAFRHPDYWLRWATRAEGYAHAFFFICIGCPFLSIEVWDDDEHSHSREVHSLQMDDLKSRGMVEEFITAQERRRMERRTEQ